MSRIAQHGHRPHGVRRHVRFVLGTASRLVALDTPVGASSSVIGRQGIVQYDAQEGVVNLDTAAVIVNEAESPELIHEEVHARARRPHHFREHFL